MIGNAGRCSCKKVLPAGNMGAEKLSARVKVAGGVNATGRTRGTPTPRLDAPAQGWAQTK